MALGPTRRCRSSSRPNAHSRPACQPSRAIRGTARELLSAVRERAGGGIYLDGGNLIRSFLDEGLVDELTVTIVGVLLGAGIPLFAGVRHRHQLDLTSCSEYPGGSSSSATRRPDGSDARAYERNGAGQAEIFGTFTRAIALAGDGWQACAMPTSQATREEDEGVLDA